MVVRALEAFHLDGCIQEGGLVHGQVKFPPGKLVGREIVVLLLQPGDLRVKFIQPGDMGLTENQAMRSGPQISDRVVKWDLRS